MIVNRVLPAPNVGVNEELDGCLQSYRLSTTGDFRTSQDSREFSFDNCTEVRQCSVCVS